MTTAFRIILFIVGIINILPVLIAFFPEKIPTSYGVTIPDVNYELLLRHRAVLFGIVGGGMLYAAFANKYLTIATIIGLVSMLSFILLYFLVDTPINAALTKVMKIDLVASVVLIIGFLLYKYLKI